MARAGGSGGKLVAVLVVLVVALGGWNYYRNLQAEQAVPRPHRGYSDAELEKLLEAYRSEAETLERALERAQQQRAAPDGKGLIAERVEDYERTRRRGERVRELAREAASREEMAEELARERRLREERARGWRLHLERLTSL